MTQTENFGTLGVGAPPGSYAYSNLWNVLIIGTLNFNYLIHGTNEFLK